MTTDPTRVLNAFSNDVGALFDSLIGDGPSSNHRVDASVNLDLSENETEYRLFVDIPGVSVDNVEITLEDDVLTISGERHMPEIDETHQWRRRERRGGQFRRALRFPESVDADAVTADYRDGVLTVTVPKTHKPEAKKITIRHGETLDHSRDADAAEPSDD